MKAIFFDIDGTLVSLKTGKMAPSTKTAVEQLRQRGILCFVATGRSRTEIEDMDMLEGVAFDGVLANNGQYCYQGDMVIYSAPIPPSDVEAVVQQVDQVGYSVWFTEADRIYVNQVDDRVCAAMQFIHTPVPPVMDIHRALEHPIYKIVPFLTPEEMQRYPMQVTKHCKSASWFPLGGDLMPRVGGKVEAIRQILQRYQISAADAMAFGDGENDMEMLALVGTGVAMGNGTKSLKAIANFVTSDCEDDGIYRALAHYNLIDDSLQLCHS